MRRIIDCHCHIYPGQIALKAVESVSKYYGDLPRQHWNGTVDELIRSGQSAGIGHFVVFSVATIPHQVSSINRFIAQSVKENTCMTGLGAMHPESDDISRDLDELQALGLSGVKLHPDHQHFPADSPKAMKIYRLCEERGLPLCIHGGDSRYDYSNPNRVFRIPEAFPDLKIVVAHLGGWSVWDEALDKLQAYPNLSVDCSSSLYWLGREKTRSIIRAFGADRVLFGTDYPFWPQRQELDDLFALDLDAEEYEKICWRNAASLYGIHFDDPLEEENRHA